MAVLDLSYCNVIFAASRQNATELKQMSVFPSKFTEIGCYGFDLKRNGDDGVLHLGNQSNPSAVSELIRFRIEHNHIVLLHSLPPPNPISGTAKTLGQFSR